MLLRLLTDLQESEHSNREKSAVAGDLHSETGAVPGTATRAAAGIVVRRRREYSTNASNLRTEEIESMAGVHAGTAAMGTNWIREAFSSQPDFTTLNDRSPVACSTHQRPTS